MHQIRKCIAHNSFFLGLLVVVVLGIYFPALGLSLKPWVKIMVFVGMLLIGFRFQGTEFLRSFRNIKAIIFCFFCGFILMPIISFLLAVIFFSNDLEMFAGVVLAGAVPTTQASSIIWADMAGGNHALAIVLMTIMNLTGVFISPLILSLMLGQTMPVPIGEMLQTLVYFILFPVLLGQILRRFSPTVPTTITHYSRLLSIGIIWVTVLTALSSGNIFTLPLGTVLFCVTIQYLSMALVSYWGAIFLGLSRHDAIAIMFCSAQVTITFAAIVGFSYFTPRSIIYVVVYHLFQQFMGQVTARIMVPSEDTK